MINRSNSRKAAAALAAAIGLTLTGHAFGQTATPVTWVGTTGDYNNGANWSSGVTPANVNNEYLEINNGGTAQISANAEGAFLNLGLNPGDSGNLQVTAGTYNVGEIRVGGRETQQDGTTPDGGGTGTVVQSGSSVVNVTFSTGTEPPVQSMYVGDAGLTSGNTAVGSYTIKDSAVLLNGIANNDQIVVGTGPGAMGTFTQQDTSSVTSTGTLIIARSGATGSYTISGGTLSCAANSLQLGDAVGSTTVEAPGTSGTFTQTGGAVTVKGIDDGRRGGTGLYTMSGGTLNVTGQFNVGTTASTTFAGSIGTFNLSGTGSITTTAGNNVFVGFNGGATATAATGTMNVSGGTLTLNNTVFAIGSGGGATGAVTISGGTVQGNTGINVEWDIGRNTGNGTLTVSGTGILKANTLLIAGTNGNNGAMTVTGGTVTTNNITLNSAPVSGASRTLTISGGSVTTGTFNQGSVDATGVTRTVNISNGSFTATGATTGGRLVTYNLTGGTSNFQGSASFDTSTLNINANDNPDNVTFSTLLTQSAFINMSGGTTNITNVNNSGNQAGVTTISGSANVTVSGAWNVTNGAPTSTVGGTLSITGGTVGIGTLTTVATVATPSQLSFSGGTTTIGTVNATGNSGGTQTISAGATVNVTGSYKITNGAPTTPGTLTISGGNVTMASLITGGSSTVQSNLNISGGTLSIPALTLTTGSTLKTDNTISLGSAITLPVTTNNTDNATLNTNTGSLSLTNSITEPAGGRTLTKTGAGTLSLNNTWAFNVATPGTSFFNANAGTTNFNTDVNSSTMNITASNSNVNFNSATQHIGALTASTGGVVTVAHTTGSPPAPTKALVAATVTTSGGKIDLTNNKLITTSAIGSVSGGTYSGVLGMVQSGRAGGAWNGSGIVTSESNAISPNKLTTLGVASGSDVKGLSGSATATWGGETVHATDTLVMYTYAGDSNLDGKIDADDYFNIDSNYNKPATATYSHGDFNYDGQINGDDYFLIDSNFSAQTGAFATGAPFIGLAGVSAVPEPASLTLLSLAALTSLRRRRR